MIKFILKYSVMEELFDLKDLNFTYRYGCSFSYHKFLCINKFHVFYVFYLASSQPTVGLKATHRPLKFQYIS